ncbi:MAG: methylated-DNA--[protein]-cysteine S-methyltransferase [Bacteroidales bacterium]|nr:methylated-DNA--[protein]-cysteine S-methyltransferase [Bacteroidales bacterium]
MATIYTTYYTSPLGRMLMASDGEALVGLWFCGQRHFAATLPAERVAKDDLPVFGLTRRWLDEYFSGAVPQFLPPLAPQGSTFRQRVWRQLLQIPHGATTTYGTIATRLAAEQAKAVSSQAVGTQEKAVSAQAVGGAVGHNPISIIIPCHRVIAADGSLTGYAPGLNRKKSLLSHESKNR